MAAKAKKIEVQTKQVITEAELWRVQKLRASYTEANRAASKAKADKEQVEKEIMDKLRRGAVVEGKLTAGISRELGRCAPPWKDLYLGHMETEHGIAKASAEQDARQDHPAEFQSVLVIGERS